MKKVIFINSLLLTALICATPAFAQSADVAKVENFMQNIINTLTGLVGGVATIFFLIGGFRYVTSSGNPEALEGAKKTIIYAGIGVAVALGAFVLSNIVSQLATSAFK